MNSISSSLFNLTNQLPISKKLTQKPIVYVVAAVALSALAYLTFLIARYLTSKPTNETPNATPIQPNHTPNSNNVNPTETPKKVNEVTTPLLNDHQENPPQNLLNDVPPPSPPPQITQTPEISPFNPIAVVEQKVEPKNVTLEEAQQALEEGIEVPAEIKERIRILMPKIANRTEDDDLKFLKRGQFFTVFTIPEAPDLIFKIGNNTQITGRLPQGGQDETKKRFHNTVRGKQVTMQYDLDRLIIPPTTLLKTESHDIEYFIIAEKRLPITAGPFEQEDLYYKNADALKPVVKQLTRFIFETGDDDARFGNYPILNQDDPTKEIVVGVIDLEWVGNDPIRGLIGGKHNSDGLIGMMVSEELIDTMIEECKQCVDLEQANVDSHTHIKIEFLKPSQLSRIATYHNYQAFLQAKNIQTGHEPMMSINDIEQLGLDLDEEGTYEKPSVNDESGLDTQLVKCTLRDAVIAVINTINQQLAKPNKSGHVREIRDVGVAIDYSPFSHYADLGLPKEQVSITFAEEQKLWLNRIMNALEKKGYIFHYANNRARGYSIQC